MDFVSGGQEVAIAKVASPAVTGLVSLLKEPVLGVIFLESNAKKLKDELEYRRKRGNIAKRILDLNTHAQSEYAEDFWGFADALEDARDVIDSALQLKWYQVYQRHQHSRQLDSLRKKLEECEGKRNQLESAIKSMSSSGNVGNDGERQCLQRNMDDIPDVFQHAEKLIPELEQDLQGGVKMNMALCGMPGLGKTTIANKMFEDLKDGFDNSCFLAVSENPNLEELMGQAWREVLGVRVNMPFRTVEEGRKLLMHKLKGKKVLLVLDDVWKEDHLTALNFATGVDKYNMRELRHLGSRLLVTTRNEDVLTALKQQESVSVQKPPLLRAPYDMQLLCYHANVPADPKDQGEWREVVEGTVKKCGGNPLALSVVGAGLAGKPKAHWEQNLSKLPEAGTNTDSTKLIMKICRPSYDDLSLVLKPCFNMFAAFPEDMRIPVRARPLSSLVTLHVCLFAFRRLEVRLV